MWNVGVTHLKPIMTTFLSQKAVNILGSDLISGNGCWLRNPDTIHFKATMISFKMSGQWTPEVSRKWSYSQNKLKILNKKTMQINWFQNKFIKLKWLTCLFMGGVNQL